MITGLHKLFNEIIELLYQDGYDKGYEEAEKDARKKFNYPSHGW